MLCALPYLSAQEACPEPEPGIQFCDIDIFCEGQQICIENITVDSLGIIDRYIWDWGDGTFDTTTTIGQQFHVYPVEEECQEIRKFSIWLKAINDCPNGVSKDAEVGAKVTIVPPPKVELPGENITICYPDTLVRLHASICPDDPAFYEAGWRLSTGFDTASTDFRYPFPGSGTFTADFRVETFANTQSCGVATATQTVSVFDEPQAIVATDNDRNPAVADTILVCAGERVTFLNQSTSADDGDWQISPRRDFSVVIENPDTLALVFSGAGTYTLDLTATNNTCSPRKTNTCRHTVVVAPASGLTFELDTTDCKPITLTIEDYLTLSGEVSNITWDLGPNGTATGPAPGTYTFDVSTSISVTSSSLCGAAEGLGAIAILPPGIASISASPGQEVRNDTLFLCRGENEVNLTASPEGGDWTLNGDSFDGSIDPESLEAGTYTVIYGNACIEADTFFVSVQGQRPVFDTRDAFCLTDSPFTFTASPGVGRWGGDVGPDGVLDPSALGEGPFTVTYTYEAGTCSFTETFEGAITELAVDFRVDRCEAAGSATTVFFEEVNTTAFETIEYFFGDGSSIASPSPTHTYVKGGDYTVRVRIKQGECESEVSRTITVEEAPQAAFGRGQAPGGTLCFGDTLRLANTSTGTNLSYEWYLNGAATPFATTENASLLLPQGDRFADSVHYIQLRAIGGCGTDEYVDSVRVLPGVQASFGVFPDSVCSGDTIFLNNNSLGIFSCNWQLDGTALTNACQLPPQILPVGPHSYELVVNNAQCNVSDTLEKTVKVIPAEVEAFFELDQSQICEATAVCATSFSTPYSRIAWDWGDGNTALGEQGCHTFQDTGVYVITQYARGCGLDSAKARVRVFANPQLSLSVPATGCMGNEVPVTLNTDAPNYSTWLYFGSDSTGFPGQRDFSFQPADTGTFRLQARANTEEGCTATQSAALTVFPRPTAGFEPEVPPLCTQTPLPFINTSEGDIARWAWQFGDGNGSSEATPTYIYDAPGTYQVGLTVSSPQGCRDSSFLSLDVLASPISFFVPDSSMACAPVRGFSFLNLSQGQNITRYTWDFGNGGLSFENQPQTDFLSPGTYPVSLETENEAGCTHLFLDTVQVFARPLASIRYAYESNCTPMEVALSFDDTDFTGASWIINERLVSQQAAFTFSFNIPDTVHSAELILDNEGLCWDRDTVYFSPVTTPISAFRYEQDGTEDPSIDFVNLSSYADKYLWDFGDSIGSFEIHPSYTYQDTGFYLVTLQAFNGLQCVSISSQLLTYFPSGNLWIPSGFTPNGDGHNDFFEAKGINIRDFTMQVFDRWGELIFVSEDMNKSWDGKLHGGKQAPEGVYTYRCYAITFDRKEFNRNGTVTLFR